MDKPFGLTIIIHVIKGQTKEAEEKRVNKELAAIRAKFKEGTKMDGYDRKKYVAKLVYMFMLGYEIDFGHMEAVQLLSAAQKFTEKQIVSKLSLKKAFISLLES